MGPREKVGGGRPARNDSRVGIPLFKAIQAGDLKAAQAVNDRIYPTVRAFYDPPLLDMHNRMKEALVLLGRLPHAYVRPPLQKLTAAEIAKIGHMLERAGLRPVERARQIA